MRFKQLLPWFGVFVFCISSVIGATLWAQKQHDDVRIDCRAMVDRKSTESDRVYATREDVAEIRALLKEINKKVDRLLDLPRSSP